MTASLLFLCFHNNRISTASQGQRCDTVNYCIMTEGKRKATKLSGYENGYEWADLGLSVKWATCNVGAGRPRDYGDYFAWGETKPKPSYDLDNCFDNIGGSWDTYKYIVTAQITPGSGHDTARENWGGSWRMPTIEEMEELYRKCEWEWTTLDGHGGCKVTGPNGNSIFLPAANLIHGSSSFDEEESEEGYYWSSTLDPSRSDSACWLGFLDDCPCTLSSSRCDGFSIRSVVQAVTEISKPSGFENGHEWVDLGLSVKWATCNIGASRPSDYGDYFAWGETKPKPSYNWDNYSDCLDNTGDTRKIIGKLRIIPDSGHDAARENWGGSWRMPTVEEIEELCEECEWKWTTLDGSDGYKVTGPNGNSIFLPPPGCCDGTSSVSKGESGYYWSSMLHPGSSSHACGLGFNSGGHGRDSGYRYWGQSIRPVTD